MALLLSVSACSNDDPIGSHRSAAEETTEPALPPTEDVTPPAPEPLDDTTDSEPPDATTDPEPPEDTTDPEPSSLEPTGSVPQRVVGVWCGGRNDTASGHWTYAFADDGRFRAANRDGGFSGVVVTEGDTMTFYVQGGRPVRSTWSVSYEEALGFDMLYLDGFSYVPGSCDS